MEQRVKIKLSFFGTYTSLKGKTSTLGREQAQVIYDYLSNTKHISTNRLSKKVSIDTDKLCDDLVAVDLQIDVNSFLL